MLAFLLCKFKFVQILTPLGQDEATVGVQNVLRDTKNKEKVEALQPTKRK